MIQEPDNEPVSRGLPNNSHRTRDIRFCGILRSSAGSTPRASERRPTTLRLAQKGALLELAKIAAAYVRLIGQLILRDALCIAQSSQIGGEHLPQVHAGSEANCAIYSTSIY